MDPTRTLDSLFDDMAYVKPTPEKEIEVTPEMIEAGAEKIMDRQGAISSASLAREVFAAMWEKRARHQA